MLKRSLVLCCAALQLLAACADGGAPSAATPPQPMAPAPATEEARSGFHEVDADARLAMAAPPPAPGAPGQPPPKAPVAQTPAPGAGEPVAIRAPLLIYSAQIVMGVFEVNAALGKVEAIGKDLGGFLAKRDDHSIVIRVPAHAFDEAVRRVEGVGDMLHRNVAAEDVTEEFRDLEVRLKSARAVQGRLMDLLSKAAKVDESIAIEKELDRVSGEIERIEGRMKFLRDRAAFSTITVRFEPKTSEQVVQNPVRLPVPWLYNVNLARLLNL
jgi:Domain of unknown function (DUF4349)